MALTDKPLAAFTSRGTTVAGAWFSLLRHSRTGHRVESPMSEQCMHDMFDAVNVVLSQHPEVGAYGQTI